MKLVRQQKLLSWTSVKECRTLDKHEFVEWSKGDYLFALDDILDPFLLIEKLFVSKDSLSEHLKAMSASFDGKVEYHDGYTVMHPNTEKLNLALNQSIDALDQAIKSKASGEKIDLEPLSTTLLQILNSIIKSGWIYDKDKFVEVQLSKSTRTLIERSVDGESLIWLNRLLLEDTFPKALRKSSTADISPLTRIVFVSHRWITEVHPDPNGIQLQELHRRLEALGQQDTSFKDALIFYDYSSMLQSPRTAEEDRQFYSDIMSLSALTRMADKMIILSEGYKDYKNRAWCFFEMLISEKLKVHIFTDQRNIEDDLQILTGLMPNPTQMGIRELITNQKTNYRVAFSEIETIVIAFQHLSMCRTTHPEDAPRIRLELVQHFNGRETTAFAKLIIGIVKFFNVTFAVASHSKNTSRPIICMPHLQENGWRRLPVPGRRQLSKFTVPPDEFDELSKGYSPMLKLTKEGIDDYEKFIENFQRSPNWKNFVVNPSEAAQIHNFRMEGMDLFPTIDHVIHTILERQPGILLGDQCLYLAITQAEEDYLSSRMDDWNKPNDLI